MSKTSLLDELYAIEDSCCVSGAYPKAEQELKDLKFKDPLKHTFHVCRGESEATRQYVVKRFTAQGLHAELDEYWHEYYSGDSEKLVSVKVVIPKRV